MSYRTVAEMVLPSFGKVLQIRQRLIGEFVVSCAQLSAIKELSLVGQNYCFRISAEHPFKAWTCLFLVSSEC